MPYDLRIKFRHALAAMAGLAMFTAIFLYSGGADPWLAAQCGVGIALVFYLWAHLNDRSMADEDT